MTNLQAQEYHNRPSDANVALLALSLDEIESLYSLLKSELIRDAMKRSRNPNYRWPLYDKVAAFIPGAKDSAGEYNYWTDWTDKNEADFREPDWGSAYRDVDDDDEDEEDEE